MRIRSLLRLSIIGSLASLLCQAAEWKSHDDAAIQKAEQSDQKTAPIAAKDPTRPGYHFTPIAHWMNDPNGPIFHNGFYHMFYQHNPYGDGWGNMHWAHARSRDLLHWEHLPIAIWPSKDAGEDHVFSGCATIRQDGRPLLLYTSIGRGKSATDYAEQWVALGDPDLIRWEKPQDNPALEPSIHGSTKVWDWRDPFLFKYKGEDYLVLGGNLNHGKGGEAVVNLYKAKDASLMHWEYLGVLFTHPDPKIVNIECPNFFELDGKWVLIISPHQRVQYFTGTFDGKKFVSEKEGLLDHSGSFYAPNSTTDAQGRRLLWGWVRGFKEGRGWNGCLTLPRELKIGTDGSLWQRPAREVEELRTNTLYHAEQLALNKPLKLASTSSQVELKATFYSGNDFGIDFTPTPGENPLKVIYSKGDLSIAGQKVPMALSSNEPLNLRVFIDHSVTEVYANNSLAFTSVHQVDKPQPGGATVELYSNEKNTIASVDIYELKTP